VVFDYRDWQAYAVQNVASRTSRPDVAQARVYLRLNAHAARVRVFKRRRRRRSRRRSPSRSCAPPANRPRSPASPTRTTHARTRRRTAVALGATLAEAATRWANTCVDNQSPRGLLDHSPQPKNIADGPLGENIYATTAPAADPIAAVQDWASEAVYYDQKRNTCSGGACGHYTQLVWTATREVGCGVGSCPRLKYPSTLVCNYSPVGNVIDQRPYP
jgi:hypothetical protein